MSHTPTWEDFERAALEYRAAGFSVIPLVPGDKVPAEPWAEYQQRIASTGQISFWWRRRHTRPFNLGIVCGAVSNLVVVDIDPDRGGRVPPGAPKTRTVLTGGGGRHLYFRPTPDVVLVRSFTAAPGVEVRANGSQVVAPPSVHPSGAQYVWEDPSAEIACVADWPWLYEQMKQRGEHAVFTPPPEAPSDAEVEEALAWAAGLPLSDRALYLLEGDFPQGKSRDFDRSGAAYELARLLIEEANVNELRRLAVLVYASGVHSAKFKNRADRWEDALRIAQRALLSEVAHEELPVEGGIPQFPESGYVGVLGEASALLAEHTEAPRPFIYMSLLACLGSAIAGRVTLATELRPQPRLYVAVLGQTGAARKSTAVNLAVDFFRAALGDRYFRVVYGVGSAEGLGRDLQPAPDASSSLPVLLVFDELRVLFDKASIRNSVLAPMLCTLFERGTYYNRTRHGTIDVHDAKLSIVGASTFETYATMWKPDCIRIGLPNRFWLVTSPTTKRISLPGLIPEESINPLRVRLSTLLTEVEVRSTTVFTAGPTGFPIAAPIYLRLEEDAMRLWDSWYNDRYASIAGDEVAARLDAYGWRLMVLLSVSEGNLESVTAKTAERVIDLLEHQYAIRSLYAPVDAESPTAAMEQAIIRQLERRGALSRRQLIENTGARKRGLWYFNSAIDNLLRNGMIVRRKQGNATLIALPPKST